MSRKFAHRQLFDVWGSGKLRVVCSCGKHSAVFQDTEELTAREQGEDWFLQHTGLREIRPKVRERNERQRTQ